MQKQQDSDSVLANLMRGNGKKVVKPSRRAGGFATQRAMGFSKDARNKEASKAEKPDEQEKQPVRAGFFARLNRQ